MLHDPNRFAAVIDANVRVVLGRVRDGGLSGGFYYAPGVSQLLFVRMCEAYFELEHKPWASEMLRAQDQILDAVDASARLDGGFGSPQTTALMLEAHARARPDPLVVVRACRYLSETQATCGTWCAEPLYITLAKGERTTMHQGTSLTTALCARGLAVGSRML
jgi:hypothetical protein